MKYIVFEQALISEHRTETTDIKMGPSADNDAV